jgi:hypothetical protein
VVSVARAEAVEDNDDDLEAEEEIEGAEQPPGEDPPTGDNEE